MARVLDDKLRNLHGELVKAEAKIWLAGDEDQVVDAFREYLRIEIEVFTRVGS